MIRIQKASSEDLQTIHDMAQVVFRHTYREILSAEQMEYMMDMMYSMPNLEKQMDEGHHYYIAFICGPETSGNVPEVDNVKSCESQVESSGDYVGAVPCGYVSVQYEGPDQDGVEVFHLHKIYVMPQAQGHGVGLALFRTVENHVREAMAAKRTGDAASSGTARIELNVNKFNKSVNFYRHLGMRILIEEDFPIGNGFYKTDYIMGLDVFQ